MLRIDHISFDQLHERTAARSLALNNGNSSFNSWPSAALSDYVRNRSLTAKRETTSIGRDRLSDEMKQLRDRLQEELKRAYMESLAQKSGKRASA